eukprot:TRINITY_DN3359_c0_g1_i1.p1 TRINITY_DN3359_c0_g1~~TRINITY_DN3359_c0_g1_i1.p1  ORF type:complete len:1239 (+),score=346.66 TRINITY_DN3359_c0_g1_i1:244-3960(+)
MPHTCCTSQTNMAHIDHAAVAREWSAAVDVHRKFLSAIVCLCEEHRDILLRGRDGAPKLSSSAVDSVFGNITCVRVSFEKILGLMTGVYGSDTEELDFALICNALMESLSEAGKVLPKYAQLAAMGREHLRSHASKHKNMESFLDSKSKLSDQFQTLAELSGDEGSKAMPFCNPLRRLLSVPIAYPLRILSPIMRLFLRVPSSDQSFERLFKILGKLNELYWLCRHDFRTGAVQHKLREFASSVGDLSILSPSAPYREILKKGVVQYCCVKSKKSGGILKRMMRRNIKMVPSASGFKDRTVVILSDALAVLDLTASESMLQCFLEFPKVDYSTSTMDINGKEEQLARIVDHKLNYHYFIEGDAGKGFFRSVTRALEKYTRRVFGRAVKDVVHAQDEHNNRPRSLTHPRSSSDGGDSDTEDGDSITRSRSLSSLSQSSSPRRRSVPSMGSGKRRGSGGRGGGIFASLSFSSGRFFQKGAASSGVPLVLEHVMYQVVTCCSVGVIEELFAGEVSSHEWKQLRTRLDSTTPEIRNIQRRSPFTILLIMCDYLRMLPVPLLQLSTGVDAKRKKLERRHASEGESFRRAFLNYTAELSAHSDSHGLLVLEVLIYSCLQLLSACSLPRAVTKRILAVWIAPAIVRPLSYSVEFALGDVTHAMDVFMFVLDNAGDFFALCERRKLMRGSLTHTGELPGRLMEILLDEYEGRWWKGVLLEQDALMKHVAAQFVPELIEIAFAGELETSGTDTAEDELRMVQEKAMVVLSRRAVLERLSVSPDMLDGLYGTVFGCTDVPAGGSGRAEDGDGDGDAVGKGTAACMPSEFLLEPVCRLLTALVKHSPLSMHDYFMRGSTPWVESLMNCICSANVVRFLLSLASHQRIAKDPQLSSTIELFLSQLLATMTGVHLSAAGASRPAHKMNLTPEEWFAEGAHVVATLVRSIQSWRTAPDGTSSPSASPVLPPALPPASPSASPSSPGRCSDGDGVLSVRDRLSSKETMETFVTLASSEPGDMGRASCEVASGCLQYLPETRALIIELVSQPHNVSHLLSYLDALLGQHMRPIEYTIQLILMLREVLFMLVSSRRSSDNTRRREKDPSCAVVLRDVLPRLLRIIFVYPSYSILHSYLVPLFSFVVSAVGDENVCDGHRDALMDVLRSVVLPECAQCVSGERETAASLSITCWRVLRFFSQQSAAMEAVLAEVPPEQATRYRALFREAATQELEPRVPKAVPRRQWWVFNLDSFV